MNPGISSQKRRNGKHCPLFFPKKNEALIPTLSSCEKPPDLWDDYDMYEKRYHMFILPSDQQAGKAVKKVDVSEDHAETLLIILQIAQLQYLGPQLRQFEPFHRFEGIRGRSASTCVGLA